MTPTAEPDGDNGSSGGPVMKRWLVWLIVGGPVLAFVLGKLLTR
jgi:hypothetical protein